MSTGSTPPKRISPGSAVPTPAESGAPFPPTPPTPGAPGSPPIGGSDWVGDRFLANCGYALLMTAAVSFFAVVMIKLTPVIASVVASRPMPKYESLVELLSGESSTMTLLVVGVVSATLGRGLLTAVRLAESRSIPSEDLPLVQRAVIEGRSEPIDQYVRLRSLSGMSGTFTKLGVSGLPLTTVALTLFFSLMALLPNTNATSFMDLAKLTLGAFIGSFVQRQVEQRAQRPWTKRGPDLPA